MRRGMVIVAALVVMGVLAGSVYAGCGSCPGDTPAKSSSAVAKRDAYTNVQLSTLGLSATQKKRVEAAQKTYNSKIEQILTKDQKAKLASSCEKASGCGTANKKGGGCR